MFSSLLAGPAVPAKERSVLPALKGLPWWGAVLVAVGATAIGAIIDTDSASTLGRAFKLFYLFGCLLAALAVRQRALFTAAAQPPLIAFIVGVTALYTINSGSGQQGLKEIILKVVLPIATSFPWILLTFLLTLAVVIARWFLAQPKGQPLFGKRAKKKPAAARTGANKTAAAQKAAGAKPGTKSGPKKTAASKPAGAKSAATKTATRKTAAAKAGAPERTGATDRARTAGRPTRPRPDAPRTGRPAPTKRRPVDEPAQTKAAPRPPVPASARSDRPDARPRPAAAPAPSEPRPARTPQRPAPAPAPASASRRRAAPQTIPARDPKTPRRTAGQMRDNGAIEDLTAGADER